MQRASFILSLLLFPLLILPGCSDGEEAPPLQSENEAAAATPPPRAGQPGRWPERIVHRMTP